MPKFRSKPTEIDAEQWLPDDTYRAGMLIGWINTSGGDAEIVEGLGASCVLRVTTIHGEYALVRPGDWVIAEPVPGRFYPCKPDIFAAKYEVA